MNHINGHTPDTIIYCLGFSEDEQFYLQTHVSSHYRLIYMQDFLTQDTDGNFLVSSKLHQQRLEHSFPASTVFVLDSELSKLESYFENSSLPWCHLSDIKDTTLPLLFRFSKAYSQLNRSTQQFENQLLYSAKMEQMGLLSAGIAHDFNNYLTVIINYCEIIQHQSNLTAQTKEDLSQIKLASHSLSELTEQILDFLRNDTNQVNIVDLNLVINSLQTLMKRTVREDIQLKVTLANFPVSIKSSTCNLKQIILNLVTNARDAMPNGGMLSIVTQVKHMRSKDHVVLSISDTGVGIPPQQLADIFKPLYSTKTPPQGTGLGLAIVKHLTEVMGGTIEVKSSVGQGTTFTISLPLSDELPIYRDHSLQTHFVGHGETILVLDDQNSLGILTSKILSDVGFNVLQASTSDQAIGIAKSYPGSIQLLLTDIVMPHKSGKHVAQELQSIRKDLKVLYMSGYPSSMLKSDHYIEMQDVFLSKPFDQRDLINMVSQTLSSSIAYK